MKTDRSGGDDAIGLNDGAVDFDFHAGCCLTQIYQFSRIVTLMVGDPDPSVERADYFPVLVLRLLPMNAESDDDFYTVVADTTAIEAPDEKRQVNFAAGIAGYVRSDDDYLFAGAKGLQDMTAAVESSADELLGGHSGSGNIGSNGSDESFRRQIERE